MEGQISSGPKTIDKIFFAVNYLLIIPIIFFSIFPKWLVGIPLIVTGIYGVIKGRGYYIPVRRYGFSLPQIYREGGSAKIFGIVQFIMGIGFSIVFYKIF